MSEKHILLSTPDVGEGNVHTLAHFYYQLAQSPKFLPYLAITTAGTKLANRLKTHATLHPKLVERYNQGEGLHRNPVTTLVFGTLTLGELRSRYRKLLDSDTPLDWLAIQETQLAALRLFPKFRERFARVYLALPDVYGKPDSLAIAQAAQAELIVWNNSAKTELSNYSKVPVHLIEPFFPANPTFIEAASKLVPHAVLQMPGNGIPESWVNRTKRSLNNNLVLTVHRPSNHRRTPVPGKIQFEGQFDPIAHYQHYFTNPPTPLVAHPSQMAQMVTVLRAYGWQGQFFALPPRGSHEVRNLNYLKQLRLVDAYFDPSRLYPQPQKIEHELINPSQILAELGTVPLVTLLTST